MEHVHEPANSFTVTRVFVALVRTAAFEFFNAFVKKSIRPRRESPATPNSFRVSSIHPSASARTLGAFCLDKGSYAKMMSDSKENESTAKGPTMTEDKLQGRLLCKRDKSLACRLLQLHVTQLLAEMRYGQGS